MTHPTRRHFLGTLTAGTAAGLAGLAAGPKKADKPGKTKNTRFAVNVEMWWGRLPFLKRLEAAAAIGYPAVEFWPWQRKPIDRAAETCKKLGLEVAQFTAWGFRPGLNDPKNHGRFVDAIGKGCEAAKKLDCKLMTVVAGDDIPGVPQEKMHEAVIAGLKKAAPVAEKAGVTLILEPMNVRVDHKGHCLYGSAPAIAICEAVGSEYVKINWDLYHMQITEGDLCRRLRQGKKWIGYVQVADNPGRNEPGTGEIDYSRVLRQVKAIGYTGYVGLECRPKRGEGQAAMNIYRADQW